MIFNFSSLSAALRYKLLIATVTPRPIALVTTRSRSAQDNAAPFSFFNVMGETPPVLVLGLKTHADGRVKDTTRNIHDTGEFVVHLVDEGMREQMVRCAAELPSDQSELVFANLQVCEADIVKASRILCAPVSFECTRHVILDMSPTQSLVVGEIKAMHVRDELIDTGTMRIDWTRYRPIGRLFGRNYVRTNERFALDIPKVGADGH